MVGYGKEDCDCNKEEKKCYDYSYKKYYVKKCRCECCFEPYDPKDDGYKSDYDYDHDHKKDDDHKSDYDYDRKKDDDHKSDYDYDRKKDCNYKFGYNYGCKKRY